MFHVFSDGVGNKGKGDGEGCRGVGGVGMGLSGGHHSIKMLSRSLTFVVMGIHVSIIEQLQALVAII